MNVGQKSRRQISTLCSLLGYSRQAYYQQIKAAEQQTFEHELIIEQVLILRANQPKAGCRKLLVMLDHFLKAHHITIGRDAFFTLLDNNGLLVRRRKRRVPRTTFSDHWMHKYPNLITGMCVQKANQLWVSDITYIAVAAGFSYLSLVTDAYSRMIVGYHLSESLGTQGCVKALKMAVRQLPKEATLIHHSDRGCQYCSTEYVEQLSKRTIAISMTQNSDPRENAVAERVNGILKAELLQTHYASLTEGTQQIDRAIEIYNNERCHSSIDMLTPVQAHTRTGELKRRWKNYYTPKQKEATMNSG